MVFMGLVVGEHQASADLIFWTDETAGTIGRANIDGSGATNILQTNVPPQGIAAGPNGTIYWGDYATDTVHRINSDGSGNTSIATGAGEVRGIAVDSAGGKVYWADSGGGYPTIQRSNLDGSDVQSIVTSSYLPGQFYSAIGVALDLPDGKVFWTDPAGGSIWSSNLDGSNAGVAFSGLTNPFMLAIDSIHHTVYWSSNTNVDSANLDGSDEHAVVTGLVSARGIALDVGEDKMFIVDNGARSILSANLDGSGLRTIVTGLEFPTGITVQDAAVVPEPSTLLMSSLGAILLGSWKCFRWFREQRR
jgi:hypothetical protein